jgi:hypothetical protein
LIKWKAGSEGKKAHTEELSGHDGLIEFLLHELVRLAKGVGDLVGFLLDGVIRSTDHPTLVSKMKMG